MFMTENQTTTNNQGFLKAILLPAMVSGVVSAIGTFGMYSYQSHKEYLTKQKPTVIIDDWTEKTRYDSMRKSIDFQMGIRNVTISNITLNAVNIEELAEIYQLSIKDGMGGGFDTSNINIASVSLNSKKNNYRLLDIKSRVNRFRKESVPFYVNYQGNISNEFFKIFLNDSKESVIYNLRVDIEWKENNSDNENLNISSTKIHQFTFIKPKSIKTLINKYPVHIIANNLLEYKKTFNRYFGSNAKIEYQNNIKEKCIIINKNKKLILLTKYSSPIELHFTLKN